MHEPEIYESPLPLFCEYAESPLERRPLSISASYTVLAAIHDASVKKVELINPWRHFPIPVDFSAAIIFDVSRSEYSDIVKEACRIPERDELSVTALCHAVEADLGSLVRDDDAKNKASKKSAKRPTGKNRRANVQRDKRLTKKQEEAWLLYKKGLTMREIATRLGIALGAVHARINRADQAFGNNARSVGAKQTLPTDKRGQSLVQDLHD